MFNHTPSVSLAFPPVGVQRVVEHEPHITTDWECEKTVVLHDIRRGQAVAMFAKEKQPLKI